MFISGLLATPFRWVGSTILGIDYNYETSGNGSGDNTYAYISLFINAVLALVGTVIWSLLDRHRSNYHKLQYWFILVLRVFLCLTMLLYGFVKVYQIQFQPPSLTQLLEPLGNFSPMGLAWTYMGFSKAFGMFAGLLEVTAGCLIIFKRTQTLGALLVIGIMTQVAMMNFSFDIPVKIFSVHLILMAMVIALGDFKRLKAFFLLNDPTDSFKAYHPKQSERYHTRIPKIKRIVLAILLGIAGIFGYIAQLNISGPNKKSQLYGIWKLQPTFSSTDSLHKPNSVFQDWDYVIVELRNEVVVKTKTDEKLRYSLEIDTSKQRLKLNPYKGTDSLSLSYSHTPKDWLRLELHDNEESSSMELNYVDPESFTLTSRGFHWINERPFNR